jgi:hypothetical protein
MMMGVIITTRIHRYSRMARSCTTIRRSFCLRGNRLCRQVLGEKRKENELVDLAVVKRGVSVGTGRADHPTKVAEVRIFSLPLAP